PPWWKDALAYLQTVPGQGEWQNLCDLWITHETQQGFPDGNAPNRVSTDNRPSAVKAWIQRHRKYDKPPSDMDAKEFEGRWKAWWETLQPAWRKMSWPPAQPVELLGGDWETLDKGGCNGFFTIILTLVWW
ncbi:hypothetical protein BC629DRAFT_1275188, partial [Irpex lacteus]